MNRYLLFRTDRIGDFLLSSVLLKSIKRNDPNSYISVVCSSKNYHYVKQFHLVDNAILYPENSFFKKLLFLTNIRNNQYQYALVCDGKKRSIYSSIFSLSKNKILFTTKPFYKFLFKFFFSKILIDKKDVPKIVEFKEVIKFLKFSYSDNDLNTINDNGKFDFPINLSNFTLLHFDEKWIHNEYIKTYNSIEPNIKQLKLFLKQIVDKTKKDLVITTGSSSNFLLDQLKIDFQLIEKNIYKKTFNSNTVYILPENDFLQIENIVSKCDTVIASHGAISHVASSFNKKIFDIVDESEKNFFDKWTAHFRNYVRFYRKDFNLLSSEIISSLEL